MVTIFYSSIFALSLICSAIYIFMWHKHFDANFTMIFTLVPVACVGYILSGFAKTSDTAVFAQKIIYIGGCFLQLFILLSIFNLCKIPLSKYLRVSLFAVCSAIYGSVLSIGYSDIFYKSYSYEIQNGEGVLIKEYGIMHSVFYAFIIIMFLVGLSAIAYSWVRKKQIPRTVISLLVIPDVICVLSFFVGRKLISTVDLVPLGYVLAQIVYILIAYRVNLYDVSDTAIDSMVREQSIGYISLDFRMRYLGSNDTAKMLVPDLNNLAVDNEFGKALSEKNIRYYVDRFKNDNDKDSFLIAKESEDGDAEKDRFYASQVSFLYDGSRKRGYIVTFKDDTANRRYIKLLDTYNEKLQAEVKEKTKSIIEMHDNLIMSLAMMVESRDNSTGGHIKRTSEGVRILMDQLVQEKNRGLSEEFISDMIKAAPMHDLGKIAVDDRILRKPGAFTDEEYAAMKSHAAEGARVIHSILLNTDDESFKKVAENVAHYHHERWDGSGYPEGLKGEEIPFEARIMAVADVYDALVSKRVYKDAFSFEKADKIITEGMGSQFDPGLSECYRKARPFLEEYYLAHQTL